MIKCRTPRNSRGGPYAKGDIWACSRCRHWGPDRDDTPLAGCPAHPIPGANRPHLPTFITKGEEWEPQWAKDERTGQ